MTMRMGAMVVAAALSGLAPAAAQDVTVEGDVVFFRAAQAGAGAGVDFTVEQQIGVIAVEPFDGGEPVAGAPYSADIVVEIVQTLADGNRIERRSTSSVARDGQGRVRREQQITAIGPMLPQGDARMVTITDPVVGVHFSLDATRRVAVRTPLPQAPPGMVRPSGALALSTVGPGGVTTSVQVAGAPGHVGEPRAESLGTMNVGGVTAEGSRSVMTIAAGAIGNVAPIEIVHERWYSPELEVVVLTRSSDPRFGETTYRLENVARGEPSPDLFQVPADYRIETPSPAQGGYFFGGAGVRP